MSGLAQGKVPGQDATVRSGADQQRLVGRGYASSNALVNPLKLPLSARSSRNISNAAAPVADTSCQPSLTHPSQSQSQYTPPTQNSGTKEQPNSHQAEQSTNLKHHHCLDQASDASNFHDQTQHRGGAPSSTFQTTAGAAPLSARAPSYPLQQAAAGTTHHQHPSISNGSSSSNSSVPDYSSQLFHHESHFSTATESQAAANAAAMEARKEQLRNFQQQKLSARSGSVFRSTQSSRLSHNTDEASQAAASRDSQSMPPPPSRASNPLVPKLSLGGLSQHTTLDPGSDNASLGTPASQSHNFGNSSARSSRPPLSAATHTAHRPSSTAVPSGTRQTQPPSTMVPNTQQVTPRAPLPAWEGVRPIISNRRMSVGGQMLDEPARRAAQVCVNMRGHTGLPCALGANTLHARDSLPGKGEGIRRLR